MFLLAILMIVWIFCLAYIDFRGIRIVEVYTNNLSYLQVELWNVAYMYICF